MGVELTADRIKEISQRLQNSDAKEDTFRKRHLHSYYLNINPSAKD